MDKLNDKLTTLHAWAIKTRDSSTTEWHRHHYQGYICAIEDIKKIILVSKEDISEEKCQK